MALTQSLINKNYIQYPTTLYTGITKATLGGYYGFDPRSIQGCQLWLDSAYASNLTISTGKITTWNNRSIVITTDFGTSGDATYGNPQNDLNTINIVNPDTFYGKNSAVADLQTYDFAIFAVVNLTTTTSSTNRFIISKGYLGTIGSVYWYLIMSSTNTVIFQCKNAHGDVTDAVSSSITAGWTVISVIYDTGGTINLYINGALQSNAGTGSTYSLTTTAVAYIGGTTNSDTSTIQIGEILLYNNAESPILSIYQQQKVEGYLASKWNIGLSATLYDCVKPFLTQFRPPDIPNCIVWLDGTDPKSITTLSHIFANKTTKDYIAWLDKSGQSNNASATQSWDNSTIANNYTYSNTGDLTTTGMYFTHGTFNDNGTKDVSTLSVMTISTVFLRPTPTNFITMFIAFRPVNLSSTNYIVVGYDRWKTKIQCATLQVDTGHVYLMNHITTGGNTVCTINDTGIASGSTIICTITLDGLNASLYENDNDPVANSIAEGDTNANILLSGCVTALNTDELTQTFAGYIHEVIVYQSTSSILTSCQIDTVQAYLGWKWGGQSSGFMRTSNYFTKFPPATAIGK